MMRGSKSWVWRAVFLFGGFLAMREINKDELLKLEVKDGRERPLSALILALNQYRHHEPLAELHLVSIITTMFLEVSPGYCDMLDLLDNDTLFHRRANNILQDPDYTMDSGPRGFTWPKRPMRKGAEHLQSIALQVWAIHSNNTDPRRCWRGCCSFQDPLRPTVLFSNECGRPVGAHPCCHSASVGCLYPVAPKAVPKRKTPPMIIRGIVDKSIIIYGFDKSITCSDLHDAFSIWGNIVSCKIIEDRKTGESRGACACVCKCLCMSCGVLAAHCAWSARPIRQINITRRNRIIITRMQHT